jgi:hypothetical protein
METEMSTYIFISILWALTAVFNFGLYTEAKVKSFTELFLFVASGPIGTIGWLGNAVARIVNRMSK